MPIDLEQVRQVARLARLRLTAEEEQVALAQLGRVLAYVERLQAVDVSGVEPLVFAGDPAEAEANLREDLPRPCLPRERVLEAAPQHDGQAFVVPRILE